MELYRETLSEPGDASLPVGVHSPGYIADTDTRAREELWPSYTAMRDRIGAERGWGPMSRGEFEREADAGSLYVGSPETVANRIATTIIELGTSRFDMKYSAGALSHERLMWSINLYASSVVPRARQLITAALAVNEAPV